MTPLVLLLISWAKKTPYHHLGEYMHRFHVRNPGEDAKTWGYRARMGRDV